MLIRKRFTLHLMCVYTLCFLKNIYIKIIKVLTNTKKIKYKIGLHLQNKQTKFSN